MQDAWGAEGHCRSAVEQVEPTSLDSAKVEF